MADPSPSQWWAIANTNAAVTAYPARKSGEARPALVSDSGAISLCVDLNYRHIGVVVQQKTVGRIPIPDWANVLLLTGNSPTLHLASTRDCLTAAITVVYRTPDQPAEVPTYWKTVVYRFAIRIPGVNWPIDKAFEYVTTSLVCAPEGTGIKKIDDDYILNGFTASIGSFFSEDLALVFLPAIIKAAIPEGPPGARWGLLAVNLSTKEAALIARTQPDTEFEVGALTGSPQVELTGYVDSSGASVGYSRHLNSYNEIVGPDPKPKRQVAVQRAFRNGTLVAKETLVVESTINCSEAYDIYPLTGTLTPNLTASRGNVNAVDWPAYAFSRNCTMFAPPARDLASENSGSPTLASSVMARSIYGVGWVIDIGAKQGTEKFRTRFIDEEGRFCMGLRATAEYGDPFKSFDLEVLGAWRNNTAIGWDINLKAAKKGRKVRTKGIVLTTKGWLIRQTDDPVYPSNYDFVSGKNVRNATLRLLAVDMKVINSQPILYLREEAAGSMQRIRMPTDDTVRGMKYKLFGAFPWKFYPKA